MAWAQSGWATYKKRKDADLRAELAYRRSQECVGHKPQRNPGGYCTVCGKGRDNS